jgi:hypothetical protein
MKKTTSSMVLIAGLLLAGASKTAAQQTGASTTAAQSPFKGKLFFNINAGLQTPSRTLDDSGSLSIFNQNASWTTSESIPSGSLFDASIGYKVWRDLGVAIGYSYFSKTGAIVGTASVPDPISFSRPQRQLPINEVAAARIDRNVYLVVMWFFPIKQKIDVALAIGPSFTRVQQDLVVDSQAFRQDVVRAASTLTNIPADVQRQSGTAKGFNVGVDGQYMFTKMIGAGAFARYNGGSVDLPDAPALEVGGFQAGIGARLRF